MVFDLTKVVKSHDGTPLKDWVDASNPSKGQREFTYFDAVKQAVYNQLPPVDGQYRYENADIKSKLFEVGTALFATKPNAVSLTPSQISLILERAGEICNFTVYGRLKELLEKDIQT